MSRTRKKAYTRSKRFDRTCRNHGSCPYCTSSRLYNRVLTEQSAKLDYEEWVNQDTTNEYEEDSLLELEKCLDRESDNNMLGVLADWELDETFESVIGDYIDFLIFCDELATRENS